MKIRAAMEQFEMLFSDEKSRGNKEKWKDYFLSDTFLEVQFSEEFTGQIQDYLKNQEFNPYDELPPYFLYELMVAYGMESLIDVADSLIHAPFMEESYYECDMPSNIREMSKSMKAVSEIWNGQNKSWRVNRGGRTIRKWEYRLRSRAFEDYIQICIEYEHGECEWEKDEYGEWPMSRGQWCYIQSGRCKNTEYGTFTRNECILKLYEYFLRTRKVPLPACVWLYRTYDFSGMKGKSYAEKYEGIRQALIAQHSNVETLAVQDKDEKERQRKWFLRLYDLEKKYKYDGWAIKPVMPYYSTYALSAPVVTEQEKAELQDILADSIFMEHKFEDSFLEDMEHHWLGGNATFGMTEEFFRAYSEYDGDNARVYMLLEYMKARMSYYERIPEYMCYEPFQYDLSMDSAEFWYYYLMKAFEGCYLEVEEFGDDDTFIDNGMIEGGKKYLSGYIQELYQPSLEWRRRFVGCDKSGRAEEVKSIEIVVLMELVITIEFHLHYIRFYVDGEPCSDGGVFSFEELLKYAGKEGQEKRFLLLLALAYIEEEESEAAYREIRKRLEKLPIDEFCLDFVTECLSNGNVWQGIDAQSTIYMENLKSCYRADIYSSGIIIGKNTPRGWRIEDPNFSTDASDEEIRNVALYGLNSIYQTKTESKRVVVEGMSNLEKAEQILELLRENNKGAALHFGDSELPEAVKVFLRENAFLKNNSVTLVYGSQDSCYFEKPLNTGMYSIDEIDGDEYEVTRKEKSCKTFWLFQDWNLQKTILYVGESGTVRYYKSLAKLAVAESLAEVITDCYRLDDVTAVYVTS